MSETTFQQVFLVGTFQGNANQNLVLNLKTFSAIVIAAAGAHGGLITSSERFLKMARKGQAECRELYLEDSF